MPPSAATATNGLFVRLVSLATATGFAGMLGLLACLSRGPHGHFVIGWSPWSILLAAIGFAAGLGFWRLLWRAEAEQDPAHPIRRQLVLYSVGLGVVAFGCFIYPVRFVDSIRRREVFVGLIMALAVLSFMGWLILQAIRWVSSNELKDGESE